MQKVPIRKETMRESYARRHPGKLSTLRSKMSPTVHKPRKPIRKVSEKKAKWLPLYAKAKRDRLAAMLEEFGCYQCEKCKRITGCNAEPNLEPHHTQTRMNENILVFKLICPICHRWIHDHGKSAREQGWLQ